MNLTKLIGGFNFKKFSKASRTDFAELKVSRTAADANVNGMPFVSPAYRPVLGYACGRSSWAPQNFVKRIEQLIAEYGDRAEAETTLRQLIADGC